MTANSEQSARDQAARDQAASNINALVGMKISQPQANQLLDMINDPSKTSHDVQVAFYRAQDAYKLIPPQESPGIMKSAFRGAVAMPGIGGDLESVGRYGISQNPNAYTQTHYPAQTPDSPAFLPTSEEMIGGTERVTGMSLPPPVTGPERAAEVAGAGFTGGAPGMARKLGAAGLRGATWQFMKSATANLTGGIVAGTGAEAGRAVGGEGIAPLVGSLAFSLLGKGGVYGFKRILRPGGEKRIAMKELIRLMDENLGGEVTLGGTAGGRMAALENNLASIPGASGLLHKKGREMARNAQARLKTLVGSFGDKTPSQFGGKVLWNSISTRVDTIQRNGRRLFGAARNLVGDGTRGVGYRKTRMVLRELSDPQASKNLKTARTAARTGRRTKQAADDIGGYRASLQRQERQLVNRQMVPGSGPPGARGPGGVVSPEERAKALLAEIAEYGDDIPYNDLDDLRQVVGDQLTQEGIGDDTQRMLRRTYGAMTDDLEMGALKLGGPRAKKAVNEAKKFWAREKQLTKRILDPLKKKAPEFERVFDAVLNDKLKNPTKMAQLFRELTPTQKKLVAKSWISNLGRLADDGTIQPDWNPETFLKNWNNSSAHGRRVIMQGSSGLHSDINRLAKAIGAQVGTRSNIMTPGATAGTGLTAATFWYGIVGLSTVATGAGLGVVLGGGFKDEDGKGQGGYGAAVGGGIALIAAMAAPNVGARLMTNPKFVKWAADTTTSSMGLAAQLGRLNAVMKNSDDAQLVQDIDTFITYLSTVAGDGREIISDSPAGTLSRPKQ